MHGGSSGLGHEADAHQIPVSVHSQHDDHNAARSPADDCQLTCSDGNLSPAIVLGVPGLLPAPTSLQPPAQVTVRLTSPFLDPPARTVPVSVPPPRD